MKNTFGTTFDLWPAEPRDGVRVWREPLTLTEAGMVTLASDDDPRVIAAGGWDAIDRYVSIPEDFVFQEVMQARLDAESVVRFMSDHGALVDTFSDTSTVGDTYPVADAINALRTLQALSGAYLASRQGNDHGVVEAMTKPLTVHNLSDAWLSWQMAANDALQAFPMFVEVSGSGIRYGGAEDENTHTLYDACVLQLVTVAAQGREFFICANESCGLPFTRHRSSRRANPDQGHASGVKYHSEHCRKAQVEREGRRRRKAAKEREQ
ncbi:hypothetical protein GCM10027414_00710 [Humibacter ginsengiterrae]